MLSSKVKQANFRLPLSYMDLIDEVSQQEKITKAAVITRALDCLKVSYDAGNHGYPMTEGQAADSGSDASNEEIKSLRDKLNKAEQRARDAEARADAAERSMSSGSSINNGAAQARAEAAEQARYQAEQRLATVEKARDAAEARASEAIIARDAAEAKAREAASQLAIAQAKAETAYRPSPESYAQAAAAEEEIARLRTLVAKREATLEEKNSTVSSKEAEIAAKNAAIAERDARIATLSEQLGAANAKIELAQTANEVKAVMVGDPAPVDEESARALYMFNMLGGVMGAFQQQVADARVVGEQEGRSAVQRELQDTIEKARNDGYRDAMNYLDNRVTTARETGAREERARIANMSFFERHRYLRMHIA